MKRTALICCLLIAFPINGHAIEKNIGTRSLNQIPASPDQLAPADPDDTRLTEAECTKLGGTVAKFSACNSGEVCSTRDQNGKAHHVCITKKKD